MNLRILGVLMLTVVYLPGCAFANPPQGPLAKLLGTEPSPPQLPDFDLKSLPKNSVRNGIVNPSFEAIAAGPDNPDGWQLIRLATTSDEIPAASGERAAKVSSISYYFQQFTPDFPAFQTIGARAMVRSEIGVETGIMGFSTAFGDDTTRAGVIPSDRWAPFYASFTRRDNLDAERFRIFLRSRTSVDWIYYDDVKLLFEDINSPGFEAGSESSWTLMDGASISSAEQALQGDGSLILPPGASARQEVAHTPFVVSYFAAGLASGPLIVEEQRLDTTGAIDSVTSRTVTPDLNQQFYTVFDRSDVARAAQFELRNTGEAMLLADNISRGWSSLWPKAIYAAENSPTTEIRLAAAWEGQLASAEIAILNDRGEEVQRLTDLQRDSGTAWLYYDGGDIQEGAYTARFLLTNESGYTISLDEPFEVYRPDPFPAELARLEFDEFIRMPWIWFFPFTEEMIIPDADEAERRLRFAKDDGFNFFWIMAREDQFELIKEAAERVGIPYVLSSVNLQASFGNTAGHQTYDVSLTMAEVEKFEMFLDSDLFQGLYIYDEPNVGGEVAIQQAKDVARFMEAVTPYPPAYSFQNPNRSIQGTDFGIVSSFTYPFTRTNSPQEALQSYFAGAEEDIAFAIETGRQFWGGVQSYGSFLNDPVASPEQANAQLGALLAMGGQGYFSFLYTTLNPASGLRGADFSETARLLATRRFNERVEELWPQIRDLSREREIPQQENVIARIAQDSAGDYTSFLVNWSDMETMRVTITTNSATIMENLETGEDSAVATEFTVDLPPGEWAVHRFADNVRPDTFSGQFIGGKERIFAPVTEIARFPADGRIITLNPGERTVAAAEGEDVVVYNYQGEELLRSPQDFLQGWLNYESPDQLKAAGRNFFFGLYEEAEGQITPTFSFNRVSGGAYDFEFTPDQDHLWIAQSFRGVTLADISDGFQRIALSPSENSDYYGIEGPFADGSVLAVEHVFGMYRVNFDGDEIERERLSDTKLYLFPSRSPNGRMIAVGNIDRGVTVYHINEKGEFLNVIRILDPNLIQAEYTAWLSDQVLVVSDLLRAARFYLVGENGSWRYLGEWNPAVEFTPIYSVDALTDGTVAVKTEDEIVVGDASALLNTGVMWLFE